jgi:hypothetical protein
MGQVGDCRPFMESFHEIKLRIEYSKGDGIFYLHSSDHSFVQLMVKVER